MLGVLKQVLLLFYLLTTKVEKAEMHKKADPNKIINMTTEGLVKT